MADDRIINVRAFEVLDSRGNPTVEVEIELADGAKASAIVPSGASTGADEAHELRDGDPKRYGGKGVLQAVANVNNADRAARSSAALPRPGRDRPRHDRARRHGRTSRVSAPTRSSASRWRRRRPRRRRRASRCTRSLGGPSATLLPMPMFNVLNGGKHATRSTDFQEFMLAPVGAADLRRGAACRRRGLPGAEEAARRSAASAPTSATRAASRRRWAATMRRSSCWSRRSSAAGYRPGDDVALALDPASTRALRERQVQPGQRGPQPDQRRDGRPLGRLVREVPHRQHRGRPGGGRLGRLGPAHVAPRQDASSWSATTCS